MNIYADLDRADTHDEVDRHDVTFVHWPVGWQRISVAAKSQWKDLKGVPANLDKPPAEPGMYMWVLKPKTQDAAVGDYIMYVGETLNLRTRMKEYLTKDKDGKGARAWFKRSWDRWDGYLYFRFHRMPEATKTQLHEAEQELIQGLMPPLNKEIHGHLANAVGAF